MVFASLKDEVKPAGGADSSDPEIGKPRSEHRTTEASATDESFHPSTHEDTTSTGAGGGGGGSSKSKGGAKTAVESFEQEMMPTPGDVTTIESLDEYNGSTIGEKIDDIVATRSVFLINRSWCLFSIDAVDFLVKMGISIHSLEVDTHPDEHEIIKYVKKKYNHETSPWIFINGEFVGGYEDVNTLYSSGEHTHLLQDLTQADRCEMVAAKSTTKPLFWFPVKVNAHAIRATGIATSLLAVASAILAIVVPPVGQIIAYYLTLDFILRILGGGKVSPVGIISALFVKGLQPKPRSGRPKQFACCCGFTFAFLGSIFYLAPFPHATYIGVVFISILALCCGMEGFFDFCLGCVFFRIGLQLKIIPR